MSAFRRVRSFIFHPFLWAIYPPLALLGLNIDQIAPRMAVRTVLISILGTAITLVVMRLVLRSWHKAAVMTSVMVIAFYTYGHVYALVEDKQVFGILLGRHRFLAGIYLVLLAVILVAVWKSRDLRLANQVLTFVGAVLVVLPVWQIAVYKLGENIASAQLQRDALAQDVSGLQVSDTQKPPDIYYVILDMYTRADVLDEQLGYDNQPFLQQLEERGFFVAGCSQSNYSVTAPSLTSSLNMEYLKDLDPSFAPPNQDIHDLYPYLWNNRVIRSLDQLGYQLFAFESGYSPTEFRFADVYFTPEADLSATLFMDGVNPFESLVLNTSAGVLLYEINTFLPNRVIALDSAYIVHRDRILYTLDRLARLGKEPGPKFVFVHILAPHNPFVFGPNGEYVGRETPFTLNDDPEVVLIGDYRAGYSDQVNYLNLRVLAAVDKILEESDQPPIILIQGDHGVPRLIGYTNAILNAYLLPGESDSL